MRHIHERMMGYDCKHLYAALGQLDRDAGRWPEIRAGMPALALAAEAGIDEACWELLYSGRVSEAVWRYYDPNENDEVILDSALEVERKLLGLFATNRACAVIQENPESGAAWLGRAIQALNRGGAITVNAGAAAPDPAAAVAAALDSCRSEDGAVAIAHVWCHWWLRLLPLAGSDASRRTPVAWTDSNGRYAGKLHVINASLPYPAIVVHPETALFPVGERWLQAAEQARQDATLGVNHPTISWMLTDIGDPPPLDGGSIYGSFFAALAALTEPCSCEPTRAVLAARGEVEGFSRVDDFYEKLTALAKQSITHVAKASDQPACDPPPRIDASTVVSTREQVLEFVSLEATRLRALAEEMCRAVNLEPSRTRESPFIEPVLLREVPRPASDASPQADDGGGPVPWRLWLDRIQNDEPGIVTVVAAGGFGKTRLIREVIVRIAGAIRPSTTASDITPILSLTGLDIGHAVRAMSLAAESRSWAQADAEVAIVNACVQRYADHQNTVREVVHRAAHSKERRPLLLVVDGLDAIQIPDFSRAISLLEACAKWHCRLLITGKPHAVPPRLRSLGTSYCIEALTPRRARRLIRDLLTDEPDRAERLVERLGKDPALARLTRVPSLCKAICATARQSDIAGSTRTAIYRKFVLSLLHDDLDAPGAERRLIALGKAAYLWIESAGADMPVSVREFESWLLKGGLQVLPYGEPYTLAAMTPETLAGLLRQQFEAAGFFVTVGDRGTLLEPVHSMLLEFLAGVGIAEQLKTSPAVSVLNLARDPGRRDCLPYAAGSLDSPAVLIDALLDAADPLHLSLLSAAECLAEITGVAAGAMTGVPTERAAEVCARLTALLESPAHTAREKAFLALSLVGVRHLESVRRAVAAAAINLPTRTALLGLIGSAEERKAAIAFVRDARQSTADRAVVLKRLALLDDADIVEAAATSLEVVGLQATAAELLAQSDIPRAMDALVSLAVNKDGASREVFMRAVTLTDKPEIARSLISVLADERPRVRESVVELLAALETEDLVGSLAGPAHDSADEVRRAVAVALGRVTNDQALRLLAGLAEDEDPQVRRAAVRSLKHFGARAYTLLTARSEDPDGATRLLALEALVALGTPLDIQQLEEALDGSDHEFSIAARLLGQLGTKRAATLLSRYLETEYGAPNFLAMNTLGRIGKEWAVEHLHKFAGSLSAAVRVQAARALGETRSSEAVAPLLRLLASPNPGYVCEAAARALGCIRDRGAIRLLVNCIFSPNDSLAAAAEAALAAYADCRDLYAAVKTAASDLPNRPMWGARPDVLYDLFASADGLADLLVAEASAVTNLDALARAVAPAKPDG